MSEVEIIIARAIVDPEKWAKFRKNSLLGKWEAKAIIAALDAAGYVIAPREPSDAMIEAGVSRLAEEGIVVVDRDPLFVWRAMLHEAAKP